VLGLEFEGEPHQLRIRGDVRTVGEDFLKLPKRQLAVLGRPGSGKTILALMLTLQLLARRRSGDPVPVLLTLSSWDPTTDDLSAWLIHRLSDEYQALNRIFEFGREAPRRLVEGGWIIPILDGLDEIAGDLRPVAVEAIGAAISGGSPAVITCRADEFE